MTSRPSSSRLDARYELLGVLSTSAACQALHARDRSQAGQGGAHGGQVVVKLTALSGLTTDEQVRRGRPQTDRRPGAARTRP